MSEAVDYLVRGQIVDVHTGTIDDGCVAIDDGEIVAREERSAHTELTVKYVAPGLIDAHVHVESSMVTLAEYARAVVPRGVTSIIHDPHEIANVLGEDGVENVVADACDTPLKARFGVPSSVPATGLQDAGAEIDPDAVDRLLNLDRVVALAEVMDIPGLLAGEQSLHEKIQRAREHGVTVDGHLPRVTGTDLQTAARYLDSDHENISLDEVTEKYTAGLRVYLRMGSTSKNLPDLVPLLKDVDSRFVSVCSDDRNPADLLDEGGVDNALRAAIRCGVDPVEAVQLATINTAEAYDLPFGRITPGAPADIVLLDDLETWSVQHVFVDGTIDPIGDRTSATNLATDTVSCDPITPSDIQHPTIGSDVDHHEVRVIDIGELQTERMVATVPCEDGACLANPDADILPAAVIERHGKDAGIGTGFVHGFGLDRGALASTVAHDAHNLVVAGVTHDAMARVANHLRDVGGGIAVYDPASDTVSSLKLPVAGLMADRPIETVAGEFRAVQSAAADLGFDHPGGIMEITFISLEVIPELRLTYNGMVNVREHDYLSVVVS